MSKISDFLWLSLSWLRISWPRNWDQSQKSRKRPGEAQANFSWWARGKITISLLLPPPFPWAPSPNPHLKKSNVLRQENAIIILEFINPFKLEITDNDHMRPGTLRWVCLLCISQELLVREESGGWNPACPPPVMPTTTAQAFIYPISWEETVPFLQIHLPCLRLCALRQLLPVEAPCNKSQSHWTAYE